MEGALAVVDGPVPGGDGTVLGPVALRDVEDRARSHPERLHALAVLGDPFDLEAEPRGHVGHPVGRALVGLDLHHHEVGVDDVAALRLRAQVEVAVAAADAVVQGHAQAEVGAGADVGLAAVSGHRGGAQVEPVDQVEDLVDEGLVGAGVLDPDAPVAQVPRQVVGEEHPAFLGDPVALCLISTDTGVSSGAAPTSP